MPQDKSDEVLSPTQSMGDVQLVVFAGSGDEEGRMPSAVLERAMLAVTVADVNELGYVSSDRIAN